MSISPPDLGARSLHAACGVRAGYKQRSSPARVRERATSPNIVPVPFSALIRLDVGRARRPSPSWMWMLRTDVANFYVRILAARTNALITIVPHILRRLNKLLCGIASTPPSFPQAGVSSVFLPYETLLTSSQRR